MFGSKEKRNKLDLWQDRLRRNVAAYQSELMAMDQRGNYYNGTREIKKTPFATSSTPGKKASVVRNIVAEIIEAQVDSNIPKPKVTARRKKDEQLAKIIEDFLRNEMDRLPFEMLNDLDERITPVQGGNIFLVEWDSNRHTHMTVGELCVRTLHPKQVIFQNGVNDINDMDYILVRIAQTKAYIKSKYGVDVSKESEESPESRGENATTAEEMVTLNIAYYRNKNGGIGRYCWVNDIELEDIPDYQARRGKICKKCGQRVTGEKCQFCGSTAFRLEDDTFFTLDEDIIKADGTVIPAMEEREAELPDLGVNLETGLPFGEPETELAPVEYPYYKPDIFPIVLRKNVSAFGRVLGDSDVDKISDQQELIKKCDTRVQEKLDIGGSIITLGEKMQFEKTDGQMKVVRIDSPADLSMIEVKNLQVNTEQDRIHAEDAYQSARNIIGITDSFQGRRDPTATSGKAKEFAAAQSAGRMESKRMMKNAMYAELFEVMFKFLLAYSDEPRPVTRQNSRGKTEYFTFNKFDFLEQDEAGEWYWNDEFLFSVDTAAPLASNREAMWQETRMNLQQGAFGNPQNLETLILFWTKMELLHYPGAADTKSYLEEQMQTQMQTQMQPPSENGQEEMGLPQMDLPRDFIGGLEDGM